ncbi:MAG: methionine adenosyltransferase [SAR202 cluster bacterium]|nr:methionine adenosyltransferase [SAR202 cluster bacterium]
MASSFTESEYYLWTSESVTAGHPDKLCDQISDTVLDAFLSCDPMARVACEVSVTTGLVLVMGEITTDTEYVDIPRLVRNAIREAGYVDPTYGFDYRSCAVLTSLDEQSSDIAQGVNTATEVRGEDAQEDDSVETLGAGDQGMMVGFACTETPELMPLPISLAHKICRKMAEVRNEGILPYLRPDGKSQVTVEYSYGVPKRVDTVVISSQHDAEVSQSVIERDLIKKVVHEVIPEELRDANTSYHVNPSGRFVTGGPVGDAGLTGRKIIVDTYGGMARHGGGAFSGKDPTKVDRSASYAARYVAKNLVAAGLADRLEVQVSYAIGMSSPTSISVETFGTNKVPDEVIIDLTHKHFDLRPGAIIRDLDLRRPIYKQTAAYGHFGREDINVPWEQTDKSSVLKNEASIIGDV